VLAPNRRPPSAPSPSPVTAFRAASVEGGD
jgi:hypothetical protein